MVAYLKKTEDSEGFHQIFWQTPTTSTLDNGEMEITATIDGKFKIVTEASIRRHIKLQDSDGISNLHTTEIFEQLSLMGAQFFRVKDQQSQLSPITYPQETEVPEPSSPPHTNVADKAASTCMDVKYGGAATTVTGLEAGQGSTLETHLTHTKKVYGAAFTKLIKKVKRLEKKDKLSKSRRKLRLVLSDEEGSDSDIFAQADPSKERRKIAKIDEDKGITLVQMGISTTSTDFTTANVPVTTAGAEIRTASPEVKTVGDSVYDIAAESLVYIKRSAAKIKDKIKGIMEESESAMTKIKRQQEQERLGLEIAVRLEEEFDEEERQRIARVHEAARSFFEVEWEDIRARVEASEELVQRLQIEEREKYSEDDQAKMLVDLINQRKRNFAAQKAKAKRNNPMTQAQQRTYMSNYIKHMGNYKLQQLSRLSFDDIKDLFETTMRRANTFLPMETEIRKGVPELVADYSQAASDELSQEELQQLMIIVPEERMNIEALQTKYPIIDWEVFGDMLKTFDRDDLVKLWSLVQERFNSIEDKEIEIWVELKRLVHHVSTKNGMDIYTLVEREYPLSRGVLTQMLVAKLLVE
ncbi:hypothetical protein Tco_0907213 [Tanacetum coccineum]|uniref:Uncharacterized protein n=1 Tax=Tanacetum coccineum TaxID=301880 RepID=A0ABQ5CLY8_9ASTR